MKDVGFRIKSLRKTLKMNQKDFSKRIIVTQSYLSRVENGSEVPSEKLIKLISLEFGASEEWLITGNNDMFINELFPYSLEKEFLNVKVKELDENIKHLLNSNSNFEYGVYAYSLNIFTLLFRTFEKKLSKEKYWDYLNHIENIIEELYWVCLEMYSKDNEALKEKEKLLTHINMLFHFLESNSACCSDNNDSENV